MIPPTTEGQRLLAGLPVRRVARTVGVHPSTASRWMSHGATPAPEHQLAIEAHFGIERHAWYRRPRDPEQAAAPQSPPTGPTAASIFERLGAGGGAHGDADDAVEAALAALHWYVHGSPPDDIEGSPDLGVCLASLSPSLPPGDLAGTWYGIALATGILAIADPDHARELARVVRAVEHLERLEEDADA